MLDCGHSVNFTAHWSFSWPFGIFFPVLVCCAKKNPATLVLTYAYFPFISVEGNSQYPYGIVE
jgi:hypothetical protein